MAESNKDKIDINQPKSWFELSNSFSDVILSTRIRLIRNLADFLFVNKLLDSDKDRIKSLVYDCFVSLPQFSFINYESLSEIGIELLRDKNIITGNPCSAVIINNEDESISCLVNETEHITISSFAAGLDCEKVMKDVYKLDEHLQEKLQFAANFDFGYLSSKIKDCGSGMKITLRIFIPSIVLSGQLDVINKLLREKNYYIKPVFNFKSDNIFSSCIFDIYSNNSIEGTEIEQMVNIQSIGMQIIKAERAARNDFYNNNHTIVHNFFRQNFAKAMYSMLLNYEEAVCIISAIKWGLNIGIIGGISDSELNSLYYRTKTGYIKSICINFNFTFEEDIKDSIELKIKRLRATLIQQAFEGIINENSIS